MIFKLKCNDCGATCWARGNYEEDINATEIDDNKIFEWDGDNNCTHEDYSIVEQDYEDEEPEFSDYI